MQSYIRIVYTDLIELNDKSATIIHTFPAISILIIQFSSDFHRIQNGVLIHIKKPSTSSSSSTTTPSQSPLLGEYITSMDG